MAMEVIQKIMELDGEELEKKTTTYKVEMIKD